MYIYESHLGGFYVTDYEKDWEWLHCDQCGDTDWPIGYAETKEEALKIIMDWFEGDGWVSEEHVKEYLNSYWRE